jgi:hypothetical protein
MELQRPIWMELSTSAARELQEPSRGELAQGMTSLDLPPRGLQAGQPAFEGDGGAESLEPHPELHAPAAGDAEQITGQIGGNLCSGITSATQHHADGVLAAIDFEDRRAGEPMAIDDPALAAAQLEDGSILVRLKCERPQQGLIECPETDGSSAGQTQDLPPGERKTRRRGRQLSLQPWRSEFGQTSSPQSGEIQSAPAHPGPLLGTSMPLGGWRYVLFSKSQLGGVEKSPFHRAHSKPCCAIRPRNDPAISTCAALLSQSLFVCQDP